MFKQQHLFLIETHPRFLLFTTHREQAFEKLQKRPYIENGGVKWGITDIIIVSIVPVKQGDVTSFSLVYFNLQGTPQSLILSKLQQSQKICAQLSSCPLKMCASQSKCAILGKSSHVHGCMCHSVYTFSFSGCPRVRGWQLLRYQSDKLCAISVTTQSRGVDSHAPVGAHMLG